MYHPNQRILYRIGFSPWLSQATRRFGPVAGWGDRRRADRVGMVAPDLRGSAERQSRSRCAGECSDRLSRAPGRGKSQSLSPL